MLNKSFINTLNKLNSITDKVILRYPVTTVSSDAGDMIANIDVSALDSDHFEEIGIYELSKFISLVSLFGEYSVKRQENELIISSDNNTAVYLTSDIFLLKHNDKSADVITRLDSFPTVAEFDLDLNTIKNFNKASSIFGDLEGLNFKSEDSNITVSLTKINRFESSGNSYTKTFRDCSQKNFDLNIATANFNKLPVMDYKVKVKYNEQRDAYRIVFETDVFKVIIAQLA